MGKILLSVDWDYFIAVNRARSNSYRETMQDIIIKWYQEYFEGIDEGYKIEEDYQLGAAYDHFLKEVLHRLKFEKQSYLLLTESHADAYDETIKTDAQEIYLLDAHSDLGYGGLQALAYEVNCANWVGKLLQDGRIKKANIIYSPYTKEYPEEFQEIVQKYNVEFLNLESFIERGIIFSSVHMCRSGPWTPPWYDKEFYQLAEAFKMPVTDHAGGKRVWTPERLSLADRINYKLGII